MKIHRLVIHGRTVACGMGVVANTLAFRFENAMRAWRGRNPGHENCKRCWRK